MVVIVNKKLAEQSWPGQDPIGKRCRIGTETMKTPWATVVGEVADVKEQSPDVPSKQQYYMPVEQETAMAGELAPPGSLSGNGGFIALRTTTPPEQMENAVACDGASDRSAVAADPGADDGACDLGDRGATAVQYGADLYLCGTAVLLAVLGIYSVIAFTVALRVQEIAIRMALGSQRAGIVGLVLASGLKLAVIGCAIGLVGAIAASRLMGSFLFGVSAMDPLVLTLASVLVLLLAVAACLLPARQAASVDPMQALRAE